jgi:hypothetical protein
MTQPLGAGPWALEDGGSPHDKWGRLGRPNCWGNIDTPLGIV